MRLENLIGITCSVVFFFWAGSVSEVSAQEARNWNLEVIGKLAGSQTGFQNWAEGGVNTLAFGIGLDASAKSTNDGWLQKHTVKLSFGLVKQDTLDFRKAEDLIRIASTFSYSGQGSLDKLSPTIALLGRSQVAPGYNFDKNPFGDGRTRPVKVSDLLSPGTFTQSVGYTYQARSWVSQRLGIAGKETVVLIERLRSLYTMNPDQAVRFELGVEAYTDVATEIFTNVFIKSTFALFSSFNKPNSPDIIWESTLNMKVNSWLNVNFEWVLLFDEDVSNMTQLKEVFSVGIFYHFV